ncbi:MAG: very short patch repair endonuclease [Flavobacterium sp.]|nr:very short patch repair endonuclease [Flavobacterium sp.]
MDTISKEARSRNMAAIKSKNTKPEIVLRKMLHANGLRFRLHRKDLPGKPDIVLPKYKTVIFVHGCFWHRHKNCKRASTPKSNIKYWIEKFKYNIERDLRIKNKLKSYKLNVLIVWECQTNEKNTFLEIINKIKKGYKN